MLPPVLNSKVVYEGRAFKVRVDEVEFLPGRTAKLDIVEHTGAITILPLDEAGNIWFIRQYRHSARETILELPAGTLKVGEDPALAANRELQEEIGMKAATLEYLCGFWLAPGYSTEFMHIYLATGLSPSVLAQDEDEVIVVDKIPTKQAVALALDNTLRDSKSFVAILLAARKLGW